MDAGKEDKKSLAVHMYQQNKGKVSPAEDCKNKLDDYYKLEKRKRKKKEGYNISKMKFHIRKIDKK